MTEDTGGISRDGYFSQATTENMVFPGHEDGVHVILVCKDMKHCSTCGMTEDMRATGHDDHTFCAMTEDTGGARGCEDGERALLACKDTSNTFTCTTEDTMKRSSCAKRVCTGLEVCALQACKQSSCPPEDTSKLSSCATQFCIGHEDSMSALCKHSSCTPEDTIQHPSCATEKLHGLEDRDGFSSSP